MKPDILNEVLKQHNPDKKILAEQLGEIIYSEENYLSSIEYFQDVVKFMVNHARLKPNSSETTYTSAILTGMFAECWLDRALKEFVKTSDGHYAQGRPNVPVGYAVVDPKFGPGYIIQEEPSEMYPRGRDFCEIDNYLHCLTPAVGKHIIFQVKTGGGKHFFTKVRDSVSKTKVMDKLYAVFPSGYAYTLFLPPAAIGGQINVAKSTVRQAIRDGHLVMPLPAEHNALAQTARDASQGILSPEQFNKAWGGEV